MATIVPPQERSCERCGRQEVWDEEQITWVATEVDGERKVGRPHCLHEWDVSGSYNPVKEAE